EPERDRDSSNRELSCGNGTWIHLERSLFRSSWSRTFSYGLAAAAVLAAEFLAAVLPGLRRSVNLSRRTVGVIILARLVNPYTSVGTAGEKSSTKSSSCPPSDLDSRKSRSSALPRPLSEGLIGPRLTVLSASLNKLSSSQIPEEAATAI